MARRIGFGATEFDRRLMGWMRSRGIDPADVLGYEIKRNPQSSTITLEMWLNADELDERTEVTGLDRAEPEYISTKEGE